MDRTLAMPQEGGPIAKRRKTCRILTFPEDITGNKLCVDQEDFLAIYDLFLSDKYSTLRHSLKLFPETNFKNLVSVEENDEEYRVSKLEITHGVSGNQPASIGRLANLTHLNLQDSSGNISPAIGRLKNLSILSGVGCLATVPDEIGGLTSLRKLKLRDSSIRSLPFSIGDLKSLQELDLSGTNVTSLPHSIGRLQHLGVLDLKHMRQLLELPPEIGDLTSLITIKLQSSTLFELLPDSIGNLLNLETILLQNTSISNLPESIGNLLNLQAIALYDSNLTTLPDTFQHLQRLKYLDIDCTPMFKIVDSDWDALGAPLVRRHPMLGCLGYNMEGGRQKYCYDLACNRARFRMTIENTNGKSVAEMMPNLWPALLNFALRAFEQYPDPGWQQYCGYFQIDKPDAVYHLLTNVLLEYFILMLIDRSRRQKVAWNDAPS